MVSRTACLCRTPNWAGWAALITHHTPILRILTGPNGLCLGLRLLARLLVPHIAPHRLGLRLLQYPRLQQSHLLLGQHSRPCLSGRVNGAPMGDHGVRSKREGPLLNGDQSPREQTRSTELAQMASSTLSSASTSTVSEHQSGKGPAGLNILHRMVMKQPVAQATTFTGGELKQ